MPASGRRSSQSVAAGGGRRAPALSQELLRQKGAEGGRPEASPVKIAGGEAGQKKESEARRPQCGE